LFVCHFFLTEKKFLRFLGKKRERKKNKKVSIPLEVVDDANQEQIKKLLTSQVFGEKRVGFNFVVFSAFFKKKERLCV
jgi:hypothetical protein